MGQTAVIEAMAHQFAQEQGVAQRQLPQCVDAAAVDRAAQRGGEQRIDLAARELAEFHQRAQLVLPQCSQCVRSRLVTPQAQHREGLAGGNELMHEGRRWIVEELPVVDAQDEPAAGGALGQRLARAGQQLGSLRQARVRGRQQRGERSEGDRARRAGRPYPLHRAALCCRTFAGLGTSRVLPSPACPAITTPPAAPESASATSRSSASRPVNGHRMRAV
jgi:hypothetical protein